MTLVQIEELIQRNADYKIKTAREDYAIGQRDCKNGIYDKWYRYNRKDDGQAYDCGWMEQNKTIQVEKVSFLR